MASLKDMINKALEQNIMTAQYINGNVIEVSRSTKKKPAFIKVAVEEDKAVSYLTGMSKPNTLGIMLFVDFEAMKNIENELDKEKISQ